MTENNIRHITDRQKVLIIIVILSAFVGLAITLLRSKGLGGSALLYLGIPTILALAFTRVSSAESVRGRTLKAITFIILISGPMLQEGFICMLMAAPILYSVGALAAWPFDIARKQKNKSRTGRLNMVLLPSLLLLMSMEGVFEETSFDRHNTVEHTQIIAGSVAEIKSKLGSSRDIKTPASAFARLFPRPDKMNARGLSTGDKHWVDITYSKWVYWNEMSGSIQFEVIDHKENTIWFKSTSDNSYLSNYLTLEGATIILEPLADNTTQVTWRISFQRNIDPAWYAEPLQRYGVSLAAELMVGTLE
jgi:hypothetical protein